MGTWEVGVAARPGVGVACEGVEVAWPPVTVVVLPTVAPWVGVAGAGGAVLVGAGAAGVAEGLLAGVGTAPCVAGPGYVRAAVFTASYAGCGEKSGWTMAK